MKKRKRMSNPSCARLNGNVKELESDVARLLQRLSGLKDYYEYVIEGRSKEIKNLKIENTKLKETILQLEAMIDD